MKDRLLQFLWPALIVVATVIGFLLGHTWPSPGRAATSAASVATSPTSSSWSVVGTSCFRVDVASSTPFNRSMQCAFPSETASAGVWRFMVDKLSQMPPFGSFATLAPTQHFVSIHAPIAFSYPAGAQLTEAQPGGNTTTGPVPDDVIYLKSLNGDSIDFEYYHDPQQALDVNAIASSSLTWEDHDSRPQAVDEESLVANDPSSGTVTASVPSAAVDGVYEGMTVTWLLPVTSGYFQIHTTMGADISADASIYPILESIRLDR